MSRPLKSRCQIHRAKTFVQKKDRASMSKTNDIMEIIGQLFIKKQKIISFEVSGF